MQDIADVIAGLTGELRDVADKTNELHADSAVVIAQLESVGISMDVTEPEIIYFQRSLVELGILTEEQFWKIRFDWEDHLNKELHEAKLKVEKRVQNERFKQQFWTPGANGKPRRS